MYKIFAILKNSVKVFFWSLKNPQALNHSNFKMVSDLLGLILKVAKEDKPYITHVAYVHPTEGEQNIVSIWAGAGMGADPMKRIKELLEENNKLKIALAKTVK
jgi:hypothetical protein